MRKAFGYILIFALGFGICVVMLNASGRFQVASTSE